MLVLWTLGSRYLSPGLDEQIGAWANATCHLDYFRVFTVQAYASAARLEHLP